MNTRGSMVVLGIAAVALLAHVSLALGAGKITGLTLSLPGIVTCVVETITVKGTGKCTSETVFFGDGNKLITLGKPSPFPHTFHHVYSKMGTYQVSVEAYTGRFSTCTGKASATVQVAGGPTITSIATVFAFDATPGALIILKGENFGDLPGQVWIHLKDYQGNDSPHQLLDTQTFWADTFVAGIVPNDITMVLDQQATVTVVAQCGAVSNAQTVGFTAARDYVDLAYVGNPPNHWQPWFQCRSSGTTDGDRCEGSGSLNFPFECGGISPFSPQDFGNLEGYHASGWGFNGDPGDDLFWMNSPLENGWVLVSTSADWLTKVANGGQVSVNTTETSAPGASQPMLDVSWYINNCGAVLYSGHMIVSGPLGVPY